jgi:hypothetical protein
VDTAWRPRKKALLRINAARSDHARSTRPRVDRSAAQSGHCGQDDHGPRNVLTTLIRLRILEKRQWAPINEYVVWLSAQEWEILDRQGRVKRLRLDDCCSHCT